MHGMSGCLACGRPLTVSLGRLTIAVYRLVLHANSVQTSLQAHVLSHAGLTRECPPPVAHAEVPAPAPRGAAPARRHGLPRAANAAGPPLPGPYSHSGPRWTPRHSAL